MTPDEIEKDREAGTPGELAERLIRIKDGITHRADRDALSNAVNRLYALTAENAALKERVLVLTYALDIWEAAYSTGRNEPLVTASETGRAALEKSHE